MKNKKWLKVSREVHSYQLKGNPELIHIIKTGFEDLYFVIYEDAYGDCNGMQMESYSKEEIKQKFKIEL